MDTAAMGMTRTVAEKAPKNQRPQRKRVRFQRASWQESARPEWQALTERPTTEGTPEPRPLLLIRQAHLMLAMTLQAEEREMVQSTASQVALGWYPDLAALAEAAGVPVEVAQAAQGASLLREEPRGYGPKRTA